VLVAMKGDGGKNGVWYPEEFFSFSQGPSPDESRRCGQASKGNQSNSGNERLLESESDRCGGYQSGTDGSHEAVLGRRSCAERAAGVGNGAVGRIAAAASGVLGGGNGESGARWGRSAGDGGVARRGAAGLDSQFSGPGFVPGSVFGGENDFSAGLEAGVLPVVPSVVGGGELDQSLVARVVTWDDRDVVRALSALPGNYDFLALVNGLGGVDGDILSGD